MSSKPRRTGTSEPVAPADPAPGRPANAAPKAKLFRLVPQPVARSRELATGLPGEAGAEDRDLLLSAIKARLRLAVNEPAASPPRTKRRDAAARVRASVLECVAALDRLHLLLAADADRNRQLRLDAFDAVAAPSPARAGFGGGRDDAVGPGRRAASPDALTLLPNRSRFLARLRQALTTPVLGEPPQFAVLSVDLEGFTAVQASLGTAAADELLGIVAARLVRAVRAQDMVSRLRGDRFGLFIATVSGRDQLRRLVCKLFDKVAAPIAVGATEVQVRPSIGIALSGADGMSAATLIRSAATALGRARRQQAGYVFFDERGRPWVPGRA